MTDIGGLDDLTGPGLEEVTGFSSATATDIYGAGAAFAATPRSWPRATAATRTAPTIATVR